MKNSLIPLLFMLIGMISFNSNHAFGAKRALLVGISDYGNPKGNPYKWNDIHGANDVEILAPVLRNQGFKVNILINSNATYKNIIKNIKTLIANSSKGDIVLLHFSMHGQPFEDRNGDELDGWDESLVPVDAQKTYKKGIYEGKNHLIDDELEKYVKQLRKKIGSGGKIYVIIDACHAGGAIKGDDDYIRGTGEGFSPSGKLYTASAKNGKNDYFKIKGIKGDAPVKYIEACRSNQTNKEIRDSASKKYYGPLSFYLAKALSKYKLGENDQWIEVVKRNVDNAHDYHKQNVVIEESL